ncbi:hypothetical protein BST81_15625 [Leptolyngbya sp. 'hensonii']|uniref:DUF3110 domain-containing protein n=1 Tax=Leptolyngbya sp. 'hensonii' TaxID=1922337 RepID=UPI00094FE136|nr:DUF3110 domain-containing protein [Leptolyngbya sp. 'hensonii']OLP17746.1 hypothetical protein BST81_15625 [Leptolyngbya sp. 'hensonii']
MRVFVLLFNARTENEGIHTFRINHPQRGQRELVLMFESEDDATRFSLMLEAQDFPPPTVEAVDDSEIIEFCESADYDYELIPDGDLILPVKQNLEQTDWQPEAPKDSSFSTSELEQIRRRLEGLL